MIHQIFDTEVVIVNLESGNYYSIGGAGIDIWRYVDAKKSRDEIAAAFRGTDVKDFLAELQREQLIFPAEGEAVAQDVALPKPSPPPTIDKFTDMRDLLLLDPIHELGEGGWPKGQGDLSAQM